MIELIDGYYNNYNRHTRCYKNEISCRCSNHAHNKINVDIMVVSNIIGKQSGETSKDYNII